ncbi:hypothetical protein GQ53DRAFT_747794 [Thozetella sp. PMI_491]|nr:hypothetical protein GQ53DRAFT_747794 [Thozetella sp. PMI_491]
MAEKKRTILVGHSLGGLLIKEVTIQMAAEDSDQLDRILGAVFFGVPNGGINVTSLIPMVGDQPNQFLVESISSVNSQVLDMQKKDFFEVLTRTKLEMFCYYETQESLIAKLNPSGNYEMNGPHQCLVTPQSARGCLQTAPPP